MRRIAILGSTGSIGISTLDVVRKNPSAFKVVALSTNSNTALLERQIREFRPLVACISGNGQAEVFKTSAKIFSGSDGLLRIARDSKIDRIVLAISGAAALPPLLASIESGKDVALANKEALAMAGTIVMRKAAQNKVKILPIDSEQSAIWQCLQGQQKKSVKNIYLTASGGPFRKLKAKYFKDITLKQALAHPRWKMGKKITVDSATLMNKGLELFEAMHLFGTAPEKIKVIVHPESIVHSMVEFIDGSVIAQLSVTDMRIPIQYALSYPERLETAGKQLDFCKLKQLNFEKPDFTKFPCLGLAYRAAYKGGTTPCALNAANEVSVAEFLRGRIKFSSIPLVIEKVLNKLTVVKNPRLDEVLDTDAWARRQALEVIRKSC